MRHDIGESIEAGREREMESRVQKALEYQKMGYNCAQAVVCAYCDLLGMEDKQIAFRLAEAFGAGMGGMETTCGAVSGAVMLAGLKCSDGNLENPKTKRDSYELSKKIVERFRQKNSSLICKELKGIETKKVLRTCPDCVKDAAQIVEEIIFLEP